MFPEMAAHSKSAMIVAFLTVNTLPIAGSAFTVCVQERHIVSIFYNPWTLGMTMWGDLRAGNI